MKFLCKIVLLFFLFFLSAPSIISLCDDSADLSSFFNLSEEEEEENIASFNEIKVLPIFQSCSLLPFERIFRKKHFIIDDKFVESQTLIIFSPPPELI